MGILALDLATKCGYAFEGRNGILSGTVQLGAFASGGRFAAFLDWLDARNASEPITAIYYEAVYRHNGTGAAHAYGGFLAIVQLWAHRNGIEAHGVPVQDIKKRATGRGNADKAAMLYAAQQAGWRPHDDNEADALWLLDLARVNGFAYHGGPKSKQRRTAEKALEARAVGGTRKGKRCKPQE